MGWKAKQNRGGLENSCSSWLPGARLPGGSLTPDKRKKKKVGRGGRGGGREAALVKSYKAFIKTSIGSLEMKRLQKPWVEECTQDALPSS